MAEKNTLSILESIKKKMIQFDQKDPKKTSSFSGDEFAYSSPEKNNLNKTTEENAALAQENQALNKDSELDNNDQKKSVVDFADEEDHEENPFISNPLTQDNDDLAPVLLDRVGAIDSRLQRYLGARAAACSSAARHQLCHRVAGRGRARLPQERRLRDAMSERP